MGILVPERLRERHLAHRTGYLHDIKPRPIAKRGIVVLAPTAYAMKNDEERARAAGCDRNIAEPIGTRALPGVVAGYVAKQWGGSSS